MTIFLRRKSAIIIFVHHCLDFPMEGFRECKMQFSYVLYFHCEEHAKYSLINEAVK